ncbi:hypothetical protein LCGC14_2756400 [marine sediment metagenome]|uniref:Uncharacterized protein n=1 Tax=marine sediment metagenome TaxID=412755 RepID=A0A0F8Z0E7_9ZZZZ
MVRYHLGFYKTSHNSYGASIIDQLNSGVRGIELDIHDNGVEDDGLFRIGHFGIGVGVARGVRGNPNHHNLTEWLDVINNWSNANPSYSFSKEFRGFRQRFWPTPGHPFAPQHVPPSRIIVHADGFLSRT